MCYVVHLSNMKATDISTIISEKSNNIAHVMLSFLLLLVVGFVDEGKYSLLFLLKINEIMLLIFLSTVASAVPLVLYNLLLNSRLKPYALSLSLFGHMPSVALIVWSLLH